MVRYARRKWLATIGLVALVAGAGACGDDVESTLSVTLYGWHGEGGGQFIEELQQFPGAEEVRVALTRPGDRRIVDEVTVPIGNRSAQLPELDGGEGLRMDFELRGGTGVIAVGATPVFDAEEGGAHRGFRAMVSPSNGFAPVGALFYDAAGTVYEQTAFHDQHLEVRPTGRVGHAAHPTETGGVLVVGGAQVAGDLAMAYLPTLDEVFGDIQIFDPGTGHFDELGADQLAEDAGVVGVDRLATPRAFHTVTPVGNDRFLVAGGFTVVSGATRPTSSIELIDLNAPAGSRVQALDGLQLEQRRGMHTATLRTSDGAVVIAGGLDDDDENVVGTVEVIDLNQSPATVTSFAMETERVGHSAVLLEDGQTIWVMGGRNSGGVLDSSEVVAAAGSSPGPVMQQPRYGAAAINLGSDHADRILVVGGFTSGGATARYEVGHPLRGQQRFISASNYTIDAARGMPQLFILPQSRELVILGGYDPDGNIVSQAERVTVDLNRTGPLLEHVDATIGAMYQPRGGFAAALLDNGRILLAGGQGEGGQFLGSAEYFAPHDPVRLRAAHE